MCSCIYRQTHHVYMYVYIWRSKSWHLHADTYFVISGKFVEEDEKPSKMLDSSGTIFVTELHGPLVGLSLCLCSTPLFRCLGLQGIRKSCCAETSPHSPCAATTLATSSVPGSSQWTPPGTSTSTRGLFLQSSQ